MKTNTIFLEVGVKAFIKDNKGKILVLKRTKPYPGQKIRKWDLPGGRIIPGETQFEALKREIKEEIQIDLTRIIRLVGVQDILRAANKHTVRITYIVQCKGQIVVNEKEDHNEFKWVSVDELKKLRMDKYVVSLLKETSIKG